MINWRYGGVMDEECVVLCDAINSVEGIATIESCCGHGKSPFCIWFKATSVKALYPITRAIDRRYGGPVGWFCFVEDGDVADEHGHAGSVAFMVNSGLANGCDLVYEQALQIADNIMQFWELAKLHNFGVGRASEDQVEVFIKEDIHEQH